MKCLFVSNTLGLWLEDLEAPGLTAVRGERSFRCVAYEPKAEPPIAYFAQIPEDVRSLQSLSQAYSLAMAFMEGKR